MTALAHPALSTLAVLERGTPPLLGILRNRSPVLEVAGKFQSGGRV